MQNSNLDVSSQSIELSSSVSSKYSSLIDVPLTDHIRNSLVDLFNYLDIYGPRMPIVYEVVTIIRFLQLIGACFMTSNTNVFYHGSLTYNAISIFTILFHIIPVQYRDGNESVILFILNSFMILFGIYIFVTAEIYRKTSKVPRFSTIIISFIFIPIMELLILF